MSWNLVKDCTVAITTPSGEIRGTGFFISRAGHLLTCAHVVDAAGGWEQVRVSGQAVSLVYLGNSRYDDFAILQVAGYQGNAVPLSLTFEPMDRFLAIGYGRPDFPQGASIDGTITDVNQQSNFGNLPMLRLRIEADAQRVQGGYSGSPVFNTINQSVIGMIAAYDNTEGALAVPLETVLKKWSMLERFLYPYSVELPMKPATKSARVFISYRSQDPDRSLAQQFYEALKASGHEPFMAGESIHLGEDWSGRIDRELEQCDDFLVLLSPNSAHSEMVTEEVRRAKQLHDSRPERKPVILPIRVGLAMDAPLNYDLRGYLNRIQQREWRSPADTPTILQEILNLLAEGSGIGKLDSSEEPSNLQTFQPTNPPTFQPSNPDDPPLPVAEPELPESEVDLASAFYVERVPDETECYETILHPGALIRIKAPRQMGKTSLMARILHHAGQHGCRTVSLSFQSAEAKFFTDLNQFLRWFCASVSWELGLPPNKLDDYWNDYIGSKLSCSTYFEKYLLPEISSPLVLALDDVDCIFPYPEVAIGFLGLLRVWHEKGRHHPTWKKLRLVMVHSTEMYIPMNINESPFNVGLSVDLTEFNPIEVQDLASRHGLNWHLAEVEKLMAMVGGHPYLVRLALYDIARQDMTLDELLQIAPTEAGPFGDHLGRHLLNLEQRPELLAAIKRVVASNSPVRLELEQAFKLSSMGLVERQGNEVMLRFELYRQYFRDRLNIT